MKQSNERKHIFNFCPDVYKLSSFQHRDLLLRFDAGKRAFSFNDFIRNENECFEYAKDGDGATFIICNSEWDNRRNDFIIKDIVAYYTLSSNAIPYEENFSSDDEVEELEEDDRVVCGIPVIQLKMFAVDEKYQDIFYLYEGEDLPIAAWVLRSIIQQITNIIENTVGSKAILLYSVPEAEDFYLKNGFKELYANMHPLYDVDNEFKAMFYPIKKLSI